jgi:hypothetical protein
MVDTKNDNILNIDFFDGILVNIEVAVSRGEVR